MLYTTLLSLHLAGAALSAAVALYALIVAIRGDSAQARLLALVLGFLSGSVVGTGSLLALVSPTLSAAALATHIVLYVSLFALIEAALFARVRGSLPFPIAPVSAPTLASMSAFVLVLHAGM